MRNILIIGGGAGGLAASVAAAWAGAEVTVLEKARRVGKKILKTGNGRCNLSNENVSPDGYNRPEFVAPVLEACSCRALRAFFLSLGLITVCDNEGRVYPRSDTASSVLDVLRLAAAERGVREICGAEVAEISRRKDGFLARSRGAGEFSADRVILACGGGESVVKTLGLKTVPFSPLLCPLKTDTSPIRGLSGLRVRAEVRLLRQGETLCSEKGEVLFRDYGLSGIVILNMSRFARAGDVLALNFLPEYSEEETLRLLRRQPHPGENLLTGLFHRRLAEAMYARAGGTQPEAVARTLRDFRLEVQGSADAPNAQVTGGGLATEEFRPDSLECRSLPGLYAVGEALDIDGRCGGYNLHWAFASGLTAGRSAALD